MALTGNNDRSPLTNKGDMDALVAGLARASRLVFALTTAGAADLLSDRRVHYLLMGGIVLLYVYLQRN